jgi:hypothetical protein
MIHGRYKKSEKMHFAVGLQIDEDKYIKQNVKNAHLRKALLGRIGISEAWCLRDATDEDARKLYHWSKQNNLFPLTVAGSWKQKLQIALLNVNFRLYRAFCKVL